MKKNNVVLALAFAHSVPFIGMEKKKVYIFLNEKKVQNPER